ncbi:hypothetical protein QYE76_008274 [Lolium multiflorum]|uniref:Uncharacterized protein n=1 Tax=Lolium multiflorum TaxID=4521 RepID=A0AAD8V4B9_LOLMU|nr:hypothetical protein QYE76_008274 [Lolium multiflorum]
MMPKRKAIGYTKPYPNEYELIPLPPKYRLPDFTKFADQMAPAPSSTVQRLRGLEEAERMYLHTLRKPRPDRLRKSRTLDEEGLPQRKEWRPKQREPMMTHRLAQTWCSFVRRSVVLHDYTDMDNSKRTNVLRSEIGLVLSADMDE